MTAGEPNLQCADCGETYYSAAPTTVAARERCERCGGDLRLVGSAKSGFQSGASDGSSRRDPTSGGGRRRRHRPS